jgi:hypothetical protein
MMIRWLSYLRQTGPGPIGPLHIYAVYEVFGIPSWRWLTCLTRQVEANEEERQSIARYLRGSRRPA